MTRFVVVDRSNVVEESLLWAHMVQLVVIVRDSKYVVYAGCVYLFLVLAMDDTSCSLVMDGVALTVSCVFGLWIMYSCNGLSASSFA